MIEFTGERFVPTEQGVIRQEHLHRYAWCLPLVAGKRVLDIASGEGYGSAMLAGHAASVVGVDIAEEAVRHAAERYADVPNLVYRQGSAADIPLESAQFDMVVSFETVEHLLEQTQMLSEIRRVLKPDGLLVMSSPNKQVYSDKAGYHNDYHVAELYQDEFVALLREQFPVVRLEGQRIAVASTITPLSADDALQSLEGLADTGDSVQPRVAALPSPVYFIALAAADERLLPPPRPSVMYSENEDLYDNYLEIGRWAKAQDAEIQVLREHVRREQQEVEHQRSSGQSLQRQLEEALQRGGGRGTARLEAELATRAEQLRGVRGELQGVQEKLQAAQRESGRSHKRVAELLRRNAVLELQDKEKEELLQMVRSAQAQLREREAQLDSVVHSRSWSLTRPLRFLARLVRGDLHSVGASLRSSGADQRSWLAPLARPLRSWALRHEVVAPAPLPDLSLPLVLDGNADVSQALAFTPTSAPLVSVFVSTRGSLSHALACLHSIAAHPPAVAYELIVLDATLSEEAGATLAAIPGVRYQRVGRDMPAAQLLTLARGRQLHLLDGDSEVLSDWLDAMLELFALHPDCGLVGSKLIRADGQLLEAGRIVWKDGTLSSVGRFENPAESTFNYVRRVDCFGGSSLLLPVSVLQELLQFDPALGFEHLASVDVAFRIRELGRQLYYAPFSQVVHHEGLAGARPEDSASTLLARWAQPLAGHNGRGQDLAMARDRAWGRRTVLLIGREIPRPDRDAGSRMLLTLIDALLAQGYLLKYWPDTLSHDPRYAWALQQRGVEVVYGGQWAGRFEQYLQANPQLDLVLLSCPHVAPHYLQAIRRRSRARIVYFGHGLHFRRMQMWSALQQRDGQAGRQLRELERRIWKASDLVLYPSAEDVAQVMLLEPAVAARVAQAYAFVDFVDDARPDGRAGIMMAGNFSHASNIDGALWLVEQVMPLVWDVQPSVRLSLVGAEPTTAIKALACERIEVTGFVSEAELATRYRAARLAVAPLRFGAGVKRGVVEALQQGLPVVASTVAAQGLEGLAGVAAVAQTPAQIAQALLALLEDDALWCTRSHAGAVFARTRFSRQVLVDALPALLAP